VLQSSIHRSHICGFEIDVATLSPWVAWMRHTTRLRSSVMVVHRLISMADSGLRHHEKMKSEFQKVESKRDELFITQVQKRRASSGSMSCAQVAV
jgi:hypothetical protein